MEYLIEGATVYTFWDEQPQAEALVVESGLIKAVGPRKELSGQFPAARHIAADGPALIPAFNDCHCHIMFTGFDLAKANLKGSASSQEIVTRLREYIGQNPDRFWVFGVGYDQNILPGGRHITRFDLDQASADQPIFIKHASGHCVVGNSKALELTGITRNTPDLKSGRILRDEAGEPMGVLLESARAMAEEHIPKPTVTEMAQAIKLAARLISSRGTLSATDCSFGRYGLEDEWRAYVQALEEGAPLRMTLMPRVASAKPAGWLNRAEVKLPAGHSGLRLGSMKIFLDGAILPRTAAFKEPYADGAKTTVMMYEPEEYQRIFSACHKGGWQVATHAIGDAAVELVVNTVEQVQAKHPWSGAGHRVEHCMLTSAAMIQKMSGLGMIIAPQPEFIYYFGDEYYGALGPRAYQAMPFRSWLRAGIKVAFGSDQPVIPHDPIVGWRAAVDRKTDKGQVIGPEERLDPMTALRCFTLEAALAGKDQDVGMLAPGKKADFVVLSQKPDNLLQEDIKVTATSQDLIKTV